MTEVARTPAGAARLLAPAIRRLDHLGVESGAILARAGIDPLVLAEPDQLVPAARKSEFLDLCATETGDPDFGLRAGEMVRPGDFGLLELLIGQAEPDGAADVVERFHGLLGTGDESPIDDRGQHIAYILTHPDGPVARTEADYDLICGLAVARLLLGRFDVVAEARFAYPEPATTAEHARIVAGELRFSADEHALLFPRYSLPAVSDAIDPAYKKWLADEAATRLRRMRSTPTVAEHVARVLRAATTTGYAEPAVAYQLAVSQRTLRRRLAEEDTSFSEVRDAVRKDEAARLLATTDRAIVDIALHLGFGDASGFHRAFKRWTGTSPGAFRTEFGR